MFVATHTQESGGPLCCYQAGLEGCAIGDTSHTCNGAVGGLHSRHEADKAVLRLARQTQLSASRQGPDLPAQQQGYTISTLSFPRGPVVPPSAQDRVLVSPITQKLFPALPQDGCLFTGSPTSDPAQKLSPSARAQASSALLGNDVPCQHDACIAGVRQALASEWNRNLPDSVRAFRRGFIREGLCMLFTSENA